MELNSNYLLDDSRNSVAIRTDHKKKAFQRRIQWGESHLNEFQLASVICIAYQLNVKFIKGEIVSVKLFNTVLVIVHVTPDHLATPTFTYTSLTSI